MATRRLLRAIFYGILSFFSFSMAFSENIRFIQRLSWQEDDSALSYRVEVQNRETKKTETLTTEENFAEFSLEAGSYRYRVSATDLLGREASASDWIYFSVRSSSFNEESDGDFSQTLTWTGEKDVLFYRVELQNQTTGETGIFETEETSARLSLPPGKFRYRVRAVDMIGNYGEAGDWREFEVFRAKKPVIKKIREKVSKDESSGKVALSVDIANITEGSTVELVRENLVGSLSEDDREKQGRAGNETGNASQIFFDDVEGGTWRLRVTNPSGLTTESEPFEIEGEKAPAAAVGQYEKSDYKSLSVLVGAGASFSFYDGTLFDSNNVRYLGMEIIPTVTAQLQFLPFDFSRSHLGFSLSFLGTQLFYRSDYFTQTISLAALNANLVYHRRLWHEKLFAAFKLGGGVCLLKSERDYKDESSVNIDIGYSDKALAPRSVSSARAAQTSEVESSVYGQDDATDFYPCAHAGLALVWSPFLHFSLELGADFTHVFATNMPTGILTPYLAAGVRF